MKISTKGRYAIMALIDIDIYSDGKSIKMKDIARRQNMSEKYLEQIISVLVKGGILSSTRGTNGGYKFVKTSDNYTVKDVLKLTEGHVSPLYYINQEMNNDIEKKCASYRVWEDLDKEISKVLEKYTIKDLSNFQKEGTIDYII